MKKINEVDKWNNVCEQVDTLIYTVCQNEIENF